MTATESFKAGRLAEAVAAQVQEVKAHPADNARRLFLFELLSFSGDLDRARRQVEAIRYDEPELAAALVNYRALLDSEAARRTLFADGVLPQFLVEPPFHVRMRLDAATNAMRDHRPVDAAKLIFGAATAGPAINVVLNGTAYESFRDADDLFGPVLEVMARGRYYWVALEQVESIAMNPPRFPRDLIWAPARLTMREGPSGEVYLPVLYPSSYNHPDELVKLGRRTDWNRLEGDVVLGIGGRTFLAGDDAVTLLEWRELQVVSVS
jgi:type VI secretion system protein ImpE